MKIGTIENNGHNTVENYLEIAAKNATALDWASAFITNAGLNSVHYLLTAATNKRKVRLLTGFYQGFTDPSAIKSLLKAQEKSNGRLEVRISNDPHFHWKSYFIFNGQTVQCVVGSSNLTNDGLNTSGEFNLAISLPRKSAEFRQVHRVFENHWQHQIATVDQSHR